MYDNDLLQSTYDEWMIDRNKYKPFYKEMVACTNTLLNKKLQQISFRLGGGKREELINDVIANVTSFYIRQPPGKNVWVALKIKYEITCLLFKKYSRDNEVCLTDDTTINSGSSINLDAKNFIVNILKDDKVNGRRIVLDLVSFVYYKTAIIEISTYTSKDWIYRNAVQLNTIFKFTRGCRF